MQLIIDHSKEEVSFLPFYVTLCHMSASLAHMVMLHVHCACTLCNCVQCVFPMVTPVHYSSTNIAKRIFNAGKHPSGA